MTTQERLYAIQKRLDARGVTNMSFYWSSKPFTLTQATEDLCHVLEQWLDGKMQPMPDIGDSVRHALPQGEKP